MKINIDILSGRLNNKITADTEAGDFLINGKKKQIDVNDFTNRLLGIILSWKEKMIGPELLDGESYCVTITDGEETASFYGKNSFPDNYDEFVLLIREVMNKWLALKCRV